MEVLNFIIFFFIYVYNGGIGNDVARDGIYDGEKYIYSSGYTSREHNYGGVVDTNYDWVIVKIDTLGNERWKVFYDGGYGDDQAYGISLRNDGKLVVVGYKDFNGNDEWRIAVYDTSNGNCLDSLIIGGPGSDYAYSVSSYQDTIFVCGRYTATGQGFNFRTLKLDPSLSIIWDSVWHGGNGNDIPYKTRVYGEKVYVSGYYDSGNPDDNEMKIKVYKRNGDLIRSGEWGDGSEKNNDAANSLCVDDTGNVYVAGYSALSSGTTRWKIIKFDSTFQNVKWQKVKSPGSSIRSEEASDLIIKDNYIYVCGYIYKSSTQFDWRIMKYSLTGTDSTLREVDFNGENDYAHALSFSTNKIFVFGSSSNSLDQDFTITDSTLNLTGYMEFFVKIDIKNAGEFYLVELKGNGSFDSIKVFLDGRFYKKIYYLPYELKIKGYELLVYVFKEGEIYEMGPYYLSETSPVFIISKNKLFYFNNMDIPLNISVFDLSGRRVMSLEIPPNTPYPLLLPNSGVFILKTNSRNIKFFNIKY